MTLTQDPFAVEDEPTAGKLSGHTRRNFIRGIAAAGASTAAAVALDRGGLARLGAAEALAATPAPFAQFTAIAPSMTDEFQVPPGFRRDVLISYQDTFQNTDGQTFIWGSNNDFLAYFPLDGSREGLLFANFEYPVPFFLHGYKRSNVSGPKHTKTADDIAAEKASVGNAIIHIRQDAAGLWQIVSPSPYNRRIFGDSPLLEVTGPLKGDARIGTTVGGSVGNCSGGITPWGTALTCEENYDGYGLPVPSTNESAYGWMGDHDHVAMIKYGWVCEHDPYDPSFVGHKHTALGRFRHENTAFRHVPGKKFVLYMGDDKANEAVYKFVSDRQFKPNQRDNNLRILQEGTLYVAKWTPEGRRRFASATSTVPLNAQSGTGEWVEVLDSELDDTSVKLRARFGNGPFDAQFATNRPEDVEVDPSDGSLFVVFTNNSTVNDSFGGVRRIVEAGDNPEALTFTWTEFAAGGPRSGAPTGEEGYASPDNLVFDNGGNLWVVTDISSASLNQSSGSGAPYQFHANNAVFMIPKVGGTAYRFANMPIQSEGTGPYFTPDEQTLFVDVQHPGEETSALASAEFGNPSTYTSYWPAGNKSTGANPSTPRSSLVAVTRIRDAEQPQPPGPVPGGPTPPTGGGPVPTTIVDRAPSVKVLDAGKFTPGKSLTVRLEVSEAVDQAVELRALLVSTRTGRSAKTKELRVAKVNRDVGTGKVTITLKPSSSFAKAAKNRVIGGATLYVRASDSRDNRTAEVRRVKLGSAPKQKAAP